MLVWTWKKRRSAELLCMFFSSKYKRGNKAKAEYVLEGVQGEKAPAMSASVFKFDKESPAAQELKAALWEKLKEIWCVDRRSISENVLGLFYESSSNAPFSGILHAWKQQQNMAWSWPVRGSREASLKRS